ncbi:hypothetical protein GGER_05680 [Serratia rubidaea]|nr:RHS domain-containing protein [Serratia rubidaea]
MLNLVEHLFGSTDSWSYEPDSPWTPLAAIEQAGESRQADIFWLHSEQNGAPLEVTDGEGGLRWSGDYDTFGRLKGQTAAGIMQRRGVAYGQPLRYARQYRVSSVYPSLAIILPASGYDASITTLKTATAG